MVAISEPTWLSRSTPGPMPRYGRSLLANAYRDLIDAVHQPGGVGTLLPNTTPIRSESLEMSGECLDADPALLTDDHEHHWTFVSTSNTFNCACGLRLAIVTILRLLGRDLIAEEDIYNALSNDLLTRCYVLAKITDESTITTTVAANASTFWNEYWKKY